MTFKNYYKRLKAQQKRKKKQLRRLQRGASNSMGDMFPKNYTDTNNYINRPPRSNLPTYTPGSNEPTF